MKVPNTKNISTRMDVNKENNLLCVGNSEGVIFIYEIDTGRQIHRLEHRRSRSPVRSCCFSRGIRFLFLSC